jgi:hypothetical protein
VIVENREDYLREVQEANGGENILGTVWKYNELWALGVG